MSSSEATFPALFAELVYLLAHEPDAVDEQQKVLGVILLLLLTGLAVKTWRIAHPSRRAAEPRDKLLPAQKP